MTASVPRPVPEPAVPAPDAGAEPAEHVSTESGPEPGDVLSHAFFDRPVLDVAPDLLGCVLVRRLAGGEIALRLTEVEAYDGEGIDAASHAYRGRTPRNAVMFGPPGRVYVYFTYGMHHCMNLVCGPEGRAGAVLLRAGEVVGGATLAHARRPTARSEAELARGPARLTRALDVDRELGGVDACMPGGLLELRSGDQPAANRLRTGPRTGVGGPAGVLPWRFWLAGEPTVSPYRKHERRRRRPSATDPDLLLGSR